MSIVSTKQDSHADLPEVSEAQDRSGGANAQRLLSRRMWLAVAVSILIVGSALRVHHLELVPLHHDEGVNGFFLAKLFRTWSYQYDPENYHGPSLYYFALVACYLLGLNTIAIRITTAAFGIGTIWIILAFRRRLGDVGSLVAASLVAVSPGAVYLSRYFIHESLFVFFTLGLVVGLLRYKSSKRLGDLVLAWSSGSLLVATKETWVITAAVVLGAAVIAIFYVRIRRRCGRKSTSETTETQTEEETRDLEAASEHEGSRVAHQTDGIWRIVSTGDIRAVDWGSAAAAAILVFLILYSSFFTNPKGVLDALKALKVWARTGEQQHTHEWNTYLVWLWQQETPLLLLSAAGAVISAWLARTRFAVFAGLWALGMIAAYSLIPYKTPWLALNFIIPMAIVVGCASESVFTTVKPWGKIATGVLICAALAVSAVHCVRLNFYDYDDERNAYVYAHTQREFLGLVNDIVQAAAQAGTGKSTEIAVTSPDYWPLPWYLRDYSSVGYYGRVTNSKASIVVGSESQQEELEQLLGDEYVRAGQYSLRPGVVLVLYTKKSSVSGQASGSGHSLAANQTPAPNSAELPQGNGDPITDHTIDCTETEEKRSHWGWL